MPFMVINVIMNTIILSEPIFATIAWLVVLLLIKPHRIKELWPCGFLGTVVVFVTWQMLQTLNLAWFIDGFLPIAGIPVFHLFWGAAAGIFVANFLPKEFGGKVVIAVLSAILSSAFGYVSEHITKDHVHNPVFSDIHNLAIDVIMLSIYIWYAEGLFYNRIHSNNSIRNS